MPDLGMKLGETYTLTEELGSGGGGVVYKAYHERLRTYVVVKQIKERVKGILESRAEVDILKNIKHMYLPQVYDFLEADGEIYTVMEYIPGKSLDKALLEHGRYSQKQVLKWANQLAQALDCLHRQNPPIIHSDIKPANIMLTPDENICLIDFNISLAFDKKLKNATGISGGYSPPEQYHDMAMYQRYAETDLTGKKTGSLGTASTAKTTVAAAADGELKTEIVEDEGMETELAADEEMETEIAADGGLRETAVREDMAATESLARCIGHGVDERSDVYSLGATLYHLLTGVKPGCDFEQIVPIQKTGIPLSEGFSYIIRKMMEIEPSKRYQNGRELLEAFRHIYELDSEYKAFQRRRKGMMAATAALYLAGMALAGTGWLTIQKETRTAYNRAVEEANVYISDGLYENAEEKVEEALELMPERIEAYERQVLLLYSSGRYEEAIRYGRDILNNPQYVLSETEGEKTIGDIFYILGNTYFELEDYSNAILCFSEAVKKNPENSVYYRDYAIAQAKTGNTEKADETLQKAISLGIGEDSIYMVQGEIAVSRNQLEDAVAYLSSSIQTSEDLELKKRAMLLCAQAYKRLGNAYLDEEIQILQEAIEQFGAETSLHMVEELADAYARKVKNTEDGKKGFYEKAIEQFQYLTEHGYSTRQTLENVAILYQQMDELERAEEILKQIMEAYPEDYRAYKRLALLEADKQQKKENSDRDYQAMKDAYERAVKLCEEQGGGSDPEMQMLETMIRDLEEGGWF